MLNWIVWNLTVLTFNCINKNYTYTKLNLNRTVGPYWIAWNKIVFDNVLMINWIILKELFICIKNGFGIK